MNSENEVNTASGKDASLNVTPIQITELPPIKRHVSEAELEAVVHEPSGSGTPIRNTETSENVPISTASPKGYVVSYSIGKDFEAKIFSSEEDAKKFMWPDEREMVLRGEYPKVDSHSGVTRLTALAEKINEAVPDWNTKSLELAKLLLSTSTFFPKTKSGKERWKAWLKENIRLAETRVRELIRIAKSPNPLSEQMRQNASNAGRQKRHRTSERKIASHKSNIINQSTAGLPVEPTRLELIERFNTICSNWARTLPEKKIARVVSDPARIVDRLGGLLVHENTTSNAHSTEMNQSMPTQTTEVDHAEAA